MIVAALSAVAVLIAILMVYNALLIVRDFRAERNPGKAALHAVPLAVLGALLLYMTSVVADIAGFPANPDNDLLIKFRHLHHHMESGVKTVNDTIAKKK